MFYDFVYGVSEYWGRFQRLMSVCDTNINWTSDAGQWMKRFRNFASNKKFFAWNLIRTNILLPLFLFHQTDLRYTCRPILGKTKVDLFIFVTNTNHLCFQLVTGYFLNGITHNVWCQINILSKVVCRNPFHSRIFFVNISFVSQPLNVLLQIDSASYLLEMTAPKTIVGCARCWEIWLICEMNYCVESYSCRNIFPYPSHVWCVPATGYPFASSVYYGSCHLAGL